MKKYFLLCLLILGMQGAWAQNKMTSGKPPVDEAACLNWPRNNYATISNNRNYLAYEIWNQPVKGHTWVVTSATGAWKRTITDNSQTDVMNIEFSPDSKMAVLEKKDSLGVLKPGTDEIRYIPHVKSHILLKQGKGAWLAYQLDDVTNELVLENLQTGMKRTFQNAAEYQFDAQGTALLIRTSIKKDGADQQMVQWASLENNQPVTIWEGQSASGFVFDKHHEQLAFMVQDETGGKAAGSLWLYKSGMPMAKMLKKDNPADSIKMESINSFNPEGTRLFVQLKPPPEDERKPAPDAVKVNVWNYKDGKLQSQQLRELKDGKRDIVELQDIYMAALNIEDAKLIPLNQVNEEIIIPGNNYSGDFVLVLKGGKGPSLEWNWNKESLFSVYLESLTDGSRKLIRKHLSMDEASASWLSPDHQYVLYYDYGSNNYFSYQIDSGTVKDITKDVKVTWAPGKIEFLGMLKPSPRGLMGWLKDKQQVLLYSEHDIFLVDLRGNKAPINVTNGFGELHDIQFNAYMNLYGNDILDPRKQIFLKASNNTTKDEGFFAMKIGKPGGPELLTMQSCKFSVISKARDKNVWLLTKEDASEFPNLYLSGDLKTFKQITHVNPEKAFNWLTSELITFPTLNGKTSQGILYKPEDFDPHKKYPVIFYYYEQMTQRLHEYSFSGESDMLWYVSHGYLVCTPDIHYTEGEPGQSAYNCIVGAANYLIKNFWVDSSKMGLCGASWGGYETNYLVTHSHLFAAAVSLSGPSDFVSGYNGLFGDGSAQYMYEVHQSRMGKTLWEDPDGYIRNSPVFSADKASTPILMNNNPEDHGVQFTQGIEFFTALRRLHKKAWMLSYDGEGHQLSQIENIEDFTSRMQQFFDHYLKGAPPPKWMTIGVPASLKGIDTGLELDTSGATP